ncbi:MAG: non-hydrolyzing UDP-N-acetylglucosamine 2-epimerase [Alphaproteobacteria bacterium]
MKIKKKIDILIVIGSRPQYIKLAPLIFYLKKTNILFQIVDTNQHYDYELSEVFKKEFKLKDFDFKLNIKSTLHGEMTAMMIIQIEKILLKIKPKFLLVFGDTNSTLSGALAASKLKIPIIHIEAGLRSFSNIPEETNRVITDKLSSINFCPSKNSYQNLLNEGIKKNNYVVGDIMFDSLNLFKNVSQKKSKILEKLKIEKNKYSILTIHREDNVTDLKQLKKLLAHVEESTTDNRIIFPIHPRTKNSLKKIKFKNNKILIIEPLGYLDMLKLMLNCHLVYTDSGGLQKEAYFLKKKCVTLRDETEWTETLSNGWNKLWKQKKIFKGKYKSFYGNGNASKKIIKIIQSFL